MKTYVAKPDTRERNWLVVDATGKTLGRLATQLADALRGKRKPDYTPHCDTGDFVVVVNAEKIVVTGNKLREKRYWRHSGYPGGIRSRTLGEQLERRPEEVIRKAVRGMLPRNRSPASNSPSSRSMPGRTTRTPHSSRRRWSSPDGRRGTQRPARRGRSSRGGP